MIFHSVPAPVLHLVTGERRRRDQAGAGRDVSYSMSGCFLVVMDAGSHSTGPDNNRQAMLARESATPGPCSRLEIVDHC